MPHTLTKAITTHQRLTKAQLFIYPGQTEESLLAKPFHIFDDEFYDVIGENPSMTTIATSESDPIFHEAVTWHPERDEVFFVQNAGAPAAGTGLNKSSIIQKISLADAEKVRNGSLSAVPITVVNTSNPQVINPNGGTNYKGNIIFVGEGQGNNVPSAVYMMNPEPPYNTTTLINNYFGRQFNSLNDLVINPTNSDLYFTDTLRLPPRLPPISPDPRASISLQLRHRRTYRRCRWLWTP
jgi:gluconolactonase